jgi:uncharacterized membrane protein
VKAMDANVTRYSAKTEKGILTVQIQKLECINDMSVEKSTYSVSVETNEYSLTRDKLVWSGLTSSVDP